jgi:hypothetical protein
MEFCPVCMLRKGLAGGVESGESSASANTVTPTTAEQAAQRFEHYELVTGEDGKPVELGRGAMGVTYKAFDVDLRCPVTLKVISEKYLGDAGGCRIGRSSRTEPCPPGYQANKHHGEVEGGTRCNGENYRPRPGKDSRRIGF